MRLQHLAHLVVWDADHEELRPLLNPRVNRKHVVAHLAERILVPSQGYISCKINRSIIKNEDTGIEGGGGQKRDRGP